MAVTLIHRPRRVPVDLNWRRQTTKQQEEAAWLKFASAHLFSFVPVSLFPSGPLCRRTECQCRRANIVVVVVSGYASCVCFAFCMCDSSRRPTRRQPERLTLSLLWRHRGCHLQAATTTSAGPQKAWPAATTTTLRIRSRRPPIQCRPQVARLAASSTGRTATAAARTTTTICQAAGRRRHVKC